ncbi:MAG: SWIM zinc finger family protein [Thiolinea sp.]
MHLHHLEQDIPAVIMQRGRDYTHAVSDLEETEPEFWQAYVHGSETYDVELQLAGDKVIDWSCTCPYDGGPVCKHVAASLLLVRDKKAAATNQPASGNKRLTQHEQLAQLLKTLPREALETYVQQILHADRTLLKSFLLRYQTAPNGEAAAKRYRRLLDAIAKKHGGRGGFIEYRAARDFGDEADELIETLGQSALSAPDKIEAVFALADGLAEVANGLDDSDGTLGSLMYGLRDVLAGVYPSLTADAQAHLFQRLLDLQSDSKLDDFGLAENFLGLLQDWAVDQRHLQDAYLQYLDQRSATTRYDWMPAAYLRDKFFLLQRWERLDEARAIATNNLKVFEFREMFVKEAIDAQDYTEARRLVHEGIAQDARREGQWRAYLLQIARLLDDKDTIRTELERVFREGGYRLPAYLELQDTYSPEEWQTRRSYYYGLLPASNHYDNQRAVILRHEKDHPALLALIQGLAGGSKSALLRQYAPLCRRTFGRNPGVVRQHDLYRSGRQNQAQHLRTGDQGFADIGKNARRRGDGQKPRPWLL